jgi:hypothetical protein
MNISHTTLCADVSSYYGYKYVHNHLITHTWIRTSESTHLSQNTNNACILHLHISFQTIYFLEPLEKVYITFIKHCRTFQFKTTNIQTWCINIQIPMLCNYNNMLYYICCNVLYKVKLHIIILVKQEKIYLRLLECDSVTTFCIIKSGFLTILWCLGSNSFQFLVAVSGNLIVRRFCHVLLASCSYS